MNATIFGTKAAAQEGISFKATVGLCIGRITTNTLDAAGEIKDGVQAGYVIQREVNRINRNTQRQAYEAMYAALLPKVETTTEV